MKQRLRRVRLRSLLHHVASIAVLLVFVLPLVWAVSASLRQPGLPPPRTIEWIPNPVAWDNYARIFELLPMARYVMNSLVVTILAVPITLVVASWAGLAMAQLADPTRRWLVIMSVLLLMVPVTAVWLTRFVIFRYLGLLNTRWSLIMTAFMGASPLFVLLFYRAYRRLPAALFDAAHLDGANALTVWWRIALPLTRSTVVAVAVLAFLVFWGDFIDPLMYLRSQELYTLTVGLRQLEQLDRTNWPLLLAGTMIMIVPAVILFLIIQRYVLQENPGPL
jgi:multiple sugar transport system permease protein